MKLFLHAALFQLVWATCVIAGSTYAVIVTVGYLYIHQRFFMYSQKEWRLILCFGLLGLLIDGSLFQWQVLLPDTGESSNLMTLPVWLICLWLCVGSLFTHSLVFLRSRYVLAALVGFVGPPFSYYAGAKLSDITLAEPAFESLFLIGTIWALLLPFGFWVSEKWQLFTDNTDKSARD